MTPVDIRDVLVAHMEANWTEPGIDVHYENVREIDLAAESKYFLKFFVYFDDAIQINIAEEPDQREYGTLAIEVWARQGEGVRQGLTYLNQLSEMFRFKNLSGVHLQAAKTGDLVEKGPWSTRDVRIPFYADSNA